MNKISTVTQLIVLIVFALTVSLWRLEDMAVLMMILVSLLIYQKNHHFFRLIKRLRWFFIVMFLIFLLNTPGEHIVSWSFTIKPTFEGLQAGMRQVLNISLMLAILSLILAKNTVQQLISGLYCLMEPLEVVGIDIKRFSARLWLTLHYVDLQHAETTKTTPLTKGLAERLDDIFTEGEVSNIEVALQKNRFTWLDFVVILILFIFLVFIWVQGF